MKGKIFEKFKLNIFTKKSALLFLLVFTFLLFLPNIAFASWAINIIGGLLGAIISGIGLILVAAVRALTEIAQYSYFLDSGAVSYGWIVVRDLCNMFFVIVLLIIAFGTILSIEKYNYKKWLPKLILMAILVNFSKTICGLLIDVAQVVMLTFVASFADISSATLLSVLGIEDILALRATDEKLGFWTVVGSYLLGLVYVIVALIVVVTMMAMLAMRIVMIWIYVVLSPLAYLMSAFPGGQTYASQWWSEFVKNLIIGPVLAFFLWLSLVALQADSIRAGNVEADERARKEANLSLEGSGEIIEPLNTKASTPGALIKFVIAIGMLIGGLKIASQIGGAAGSIAGKGMSYVNKAGNIGLKGAAAITGVRAAKGVYKNYSAMKKSKREERYKSTAVNISGKVGRAKEGVSDFVSNATTKATNIITNTKLFGNKKEKADILDNQVARDKEDLAVMRDNFYNKKGEVNGYTYNNSTNKAERGWYRGDEKVKEKEVEESVKEKEEKLSEDIKTNSEESKKLKEKQAKINKTVQSVLLGGAVAGLSFFAPVPAFLAATAPILHKNLKKSAKDDIDIGSNYRTGEIKKEEEAIKDEVDETVLAKMDDKAITAFMRAAAGMEAMRRGLLTSDRARALKESMKKELGGEKKDGSFKDKKLGAYFESVASKKNISATKAFQDLHSADPLVKSRAERDIRDSLEKGAYSLELLDTQALKDIVPDLVKLMKLKEFTSQFSALKDQGKKREIVNIIKGQTKDLAEKMNKASSDVEKNNIEASMMEGIKKLAQIKDINTATEHFQNNPQQQEKYQKEIVADFSFTQMVDIFNGDNKDQQEAIKNIVGTATAANSGLGKEDLRKELLKIFNKAEDSLGGTSPNAKSITKIIGIPSGT